MGSILSLFLILFAIEKGLNGPKSCKVGESITMLYWWGPLGTIWGRFEPILLPRRIKLEQFQGWFHPFFCPKLSTKGSRNYCMFIVCPIIIYLVAFTMGSKWVQNGPKWSQMVPKGPQQYSMIMLCPTTHDLGQFRPFPIAKKMRNTLKMDAIILL